MRRTLVFTALALALSARAQPKSEAKAPPERAIAHVDASSATQRQQQSLIEEGHRLYRSGNFKEALNLAEEALKFNPSDKNALSLKYSLVGRIGMSKSANPTQSAGTRASNPEVPIAMQQPKKITVEGAPPPTPETPTPNHRSPLSPLVPLGAGAVAIAAAYTVKRSNATASGEEKTGKDVEPASKTEKIIGYILIGAAVVAVVLLTRGVILRLLPAAEGMAARAGIQAARLAQSEAGALGPGAAAIAEEEAGQVTNALPRVLARVIPYSDEVWDSLRTIGSPGKNQTFVTVAEDIAGLSARQIQQKLAIDPAVRYIVIRFPTPTQGIASPTVYENPNFIGRGLTAGGAREYIMDNIPIPKNAIIEIIE